MITIHYQDKTTTEMVLALEKDLNSPEFQNIEEDWLYRKMIMLFNQRLCIEKAYEDYLAFFDEVNEMEYLKKFLPKEEQVVFEGIVITAKNNPETSVWQLIQQNESLVEAIQKVLQTSDEILNQNYKSVAIQILLLSKKLSCQSKKNVIVAVNNISEKFDESLTQKFKDLCVLEA
ncbi:hypothetical protein KC901_01225 [Patescibacteria group bacterium]|nr:hypothetical protein [Patescibacteria group bacterium]